MPVRAQANHTIRQDFQLVAEGDKLSQLVQVLQMQAARNCFSNLSLKGYMHARAGQPHDHAGV